MRRIIYLAVLMALITSVTAVTAPRSAHAIDYTTIQIRRDTAAAWSSYNPVLAQGEIGYELSGSPLRATAQKVGDGITAWNSLPYTVPTAAGSYYMVGRDYTTLAAAVAALGSTKATLAYSTAQTVSADLTIPATLELMPMNGAVITVNSGKTLTYLGNTSRWPRTQIFAGPGTVTGLQSATPEHFGAKGDNVTDDLPAFNAAVNALNVQLNANYGAAGILRLGHKTYYLNGTWVLNTTVHIVGEGGGLGAGWGTKLRFPANTTGIYIAKAGSTAYPKGADATKIEGVYLAGTGTTATAHGFDMRGMGVISHCTTDSFGGDGIHVDSMGTGENADMWVLEYNYVKNNKRHGIYVVGGNSNAGMAMSNTCSGNGGWGIYDSSFLGNTYVANSVDSNTLGSYKADGVSATNLFLNCYAEGGQPSPNIVYPSMVLGGQNMNHNTGNALTLDGNILSGSRLRWLDAATGNTEISLGSDSNGLLGIYDNNSGGSAYRLLPGTKRFDLQADSTINLLSLYGANFTGRSLPRAGIGFEDGFYAGPTYVRHFWAAGMPTSGTWKQGDVVWNTLPTVGTPTGYWLRVTTGGGNVLDTDWIAK